MSDQLRPGFDPIATLDELTREQVGEDIWVIGGAAVFTSTIAQADELLLTQVEGDFGCTKFFPPYREDFVLGEQGAEQHEERDRLSLRTLAAAWATVSAQRSARFQPMGSWPARVLG